MASIINASTSGVGGLISTADNSGVLHLQTGGTTRVHVSAAGNVGINTIPNDSSHLEIAPGTTTKAPLEFDPGVLMTVPDDGSFEYDGSLFYCSPLDSRRGILPAEHYFRLNSGFLGQNINTVQPVFGVGITLAASTVYEFEIFYILNKTAGTGSHTILVGFGGTATINNILVRYEAAGQGVALPAAFGSAVGSLAATTTDISISPASIVSAARTESVLIKGTVSINASGTFIPQYRLAAAPGGAYTTQAGSYIKIKPIGPAGSNINVGGFA